MTELSLHILDIAQNSVVAGSKLITIEIVDSIKDNTLTFSIEDNGKGMSEEFLSHVTDPFTTTRTTRKVGMGISLLKSAAEATGGFLSITSKLGIGTKTTANFTRNHIDRQPMGDIASTMVTLITMNTNIDFLYKHSFIKEDATVTNFSVDTRQLKEILGKVALDEPEIIDWIKQYFIESIAELEK